MISTLPTPAASREQPLFPCIIPSSISTVQREFSRLFLQSRTALSKKILRPAHSGIQADGPRLRIYCACFVHGHRPVEDHLPAQLFRNSFRRIQFGPSHIIQRRASFQIVLCFGCFALPLSSNPNRSSPGASGIPPAGRSPGGTNPFPHGIPSGRKLSIPGRENGQITNSLPVLRNPNLVSGCAFLPGSSASAASSG